MWDHLGRRVQVKNSGGTLLATYTYDPLDRLRLIDYGAGVRIRFRYVGLSTAAARTFDDATATVSRHIGTGWSGERLLDWTGSGSNIRVYGETGHHDTTWLAGSTGTVAALRYDPWGAPGSTPPSGYSPFRFQGSYLDDLRDADNSNDLSGWSAAGCPIARAVRVRGFAAGRARPIPRPPPLCLRAGRADRALGSGRRRQYTLLPIRRQPQPGTTKYQLKNVQYDLIAGPLQLALGSVTTGWDARMSSKSTERHHHHYVLTTWPFVSIRSLASADLRVTTMAKITFTSGRKQIDYAFANKNVHSF